MRAARSMLWVAMMAARPEARTNWASAENTRSAVRGSRFPVGSSASRMHGAVGAAGAMATRCGPLLEAEIAEQFAGASVGVAAREPAYQLRHRDVFERGEFRQQMVRLVDDAHFDATQPGPGGIPEPGRRGLAD